MVNQISKRMLEICAREGLTVNQATMDALVQVGGPGRSPATKRERCPGKGEGGGGLQSSLITWDSQTGRVLPTLALLCSSAGHHARALRALRAARAWHAAPHVVCQPPVVPPPPYKHAVCQRRRHPAHPGPAADDPPADTLPLLRPGRPGRPGTQPAGPPRLSPSCRGLLPWRPALTHAASPLASLRVRPPSAAAPSRAAPPPRRSRAAA